jgi:hypothetical protein
MSIACFFFQKNYMNPFCHCKPVLLSDLYLLQDHVNDIDFDYKEYARQRFEQYWQKKQALLTS